MVQVHVPSLDAHLVRWAAYLVQPEVLGPERKGLHLASLVSPVPGPQGPRLPAGGGQAPPAPVASPVSP